MGYSLADLRKFLMEAIETLCFDHFPEARDEFSTGMSKSDKIRRLLDYCRRRNLTSQLLLAIQAARPDQFDRHFGGLSPGQLQSIFTLSAATPGLGGSLLASEAMLDRLIVSQYQAMRYYLVFALGLVTLGTVIVVVALLADYSLPVTFRPLIGLSGGFVASLSFFQLKEILNRKEKAQMFETIKVGLSTLERVQESVDADTRNRIDNLLWQVIEKTAVG